MSIVIVIEDDHGALQRSCEALREGGLEVLAAASCDEAITLLDVVTGSALGGILLGATREVGLIAHIQQRFGEREIVIREHASLSSAVLALRRPTYRTDEIVVHRVYQLGEQTTRSRDDLPLVLRYFLLHFNEVGGKQIEGYSNAAMAHLCNRDWPGGVREIRATVEAMVQSAPGPLITLAQLTRDGKNGAASAVIFTAPLGLTIEELSRSYALQSLELFGGNKSKAARILGIGTKTLHRWLGRWQEPKQEGEPT